MSTYPEFKWKEISQHAYCVLVESLGGYKAMKVFGTITDIGGQYGEPEVMTEWGPKEGDYPFVKTSRNPEVEGSDKFYIAFWREVEP